MDIERGLLVGGDLRIKALKWAFLARTPQGSYKWGAGGEDYSLFTIRKQEEVVRTMC